jgi:uncharacterized protein
VTVRKLLLCAALALGAACTLAAQELQPVPPLQARVTDLTGTLTAGQQAELEQKLAAFEQRKGAQLALLIVPTTEPEAIEQYSIRVMESWKIGREKIDDGVLLLVALNDRALRIEVGYGLEGALPDATGWRIIDDTIKPLFRQGDIFGGVSAGLQRIMSVVDGEALPEPDRGWSGRGDTLFNLVPVFFFGALLGGSILRAIFGRTLGATLTGGLIGLIVWFVSKLLFAALIAAVLAGLFSLFGGMPMRSRGGDWGGGFAGGRGGGFGGGGLGGGGFRGGGGRFGGGGASGRW